MLENVMKSLALHKDEVGLPSEHHRLEFLDDGMDAHVPSWGARLCYGAGSTYLSGLAIGGAWGLAEGLNNPICRGSRRLRINAILNACTNKGPLVANSLASLAIIYNIINGTLIYSRSGKEDAAGSVASAFTSGMLFRGAGRNGLIAGTLCGGSVLALNMMKSRS